MHSRALNKCLAAIVSFTFVVTTIFVPAPLLAQEAVPITLQPYDFSLKEVLIPETIGSMHDVYIRKEMDEKVIIEIQDAHGIFEAQKHIQELIRYFQDEFNVNLIGLEGATGRIPTALFRSLPIEEVKE